MPEEWGGDTIVCPISAKTGEGIDNLLENLVLLPPRCWSSRPTRTAPPAARSSRPRLDKGRGPITTVLVQNGTLQSGRHHHRRYGRRPCPRDDQRQGSARDERPARPSRSRSPVCPRCRARATSFNAVDDERMARELVEQRKQQKKDAAQRRQQEGLARRPVRPHPAGRDEGASTSSSRPTCRAAAEAVKSSLEKLSNEEVRVQVIHSGVGAINESDVMLAATSNAIIVGFNVRPDAAARDERRRAAERGYPHVPRHLRLHRRDRGGHEGHARAEVQGGRHRPRRGPPDLQGLQGRHRLRAAMSPTARSCATARCASCATASSCYEGDLASLQPLQGRRQGSRRRLRVRPAGRQVQRRQGRRRDRSASSWRRSSSE